LAITSRSTSFLRRAATRSAAVAMHRSPRGLDASGSCAA
jgi:hypothetical protein